MRSCHPEHRSTAESNSATSTLKDISPTSHAIFHAILSGTYKLSERLTEITLPCHWSAVGTFEWRLTMTCSVRDNRCEKVFKDSSFSLLHLAAWAWLHFLLLLARALAWNAWASTTVCPGNLSKKVRQVFGLSSGYRWQSLRSVRNGNLAWSQWCRYMTNLSLVSGVIKNSGSGSYRPVRFAGEEETSTIISASVHAWICFGTKECSLVVKQSIPQTWGVWGTKNNCVQLLVTINEAQTYWYWVGWATLSQMLRTIHEGSEWEAETHWGMESPLCPMHTLRVARLLASDLCPQWPDVTGYKQYWRDVRQRDLIARERTWVQSSE
jgi:hypothetical protein